MNFNFGQKLLQVFLMGLLVSSVIIQGGPVVASSRMDVESMKKGAESIVGKLVSGDYEGVRSNFDNNLRTNLPASKIKEVWEGVKAQTGEYKSHGTPYYQKVQGGNGIRIRCQMERGAVNVDVYYNAEEKIAGLWVVP